MVERQGIDAETVKALAKKYNMEVVGPPIPQVSRSSSSEQHSCDGLSDFVSPPRPRPARREFAA